MNYGHENRTNLAINNSHIWILVRKYTFNIQRYYNVSTAYWHCVRKCAQIATRRDYACRLGPFANEIVNRRQRNPTDHMGVIPSQMSNVVRDRRNKQCQHLVTSAVSFATFAVRWLGSTPRLGRTASFFTQGHANRKVGFLQTRKMQYALWKWWKIGFDTTEHESWKID